MRTCTFTGKPLSKENTFYNPDGTFMNVNSRLFLDSISELPIESLEILIKLSSEARNKKLSGWQKFLKIIKFKI